MLCRECLGDNAWTLLVLHKQANVLEFASKRLQEHSIQAFLEHDQSWFCNWHKWIFYVFIIGPLKMCHEKFHSRYWRVSVCVCCDLPCLGSWEWQIALVEKVHCGVNFDYQLQASMVFSRFLGQFGTFFFFSPSTN